MSRQQFQIRVIQKGGGTITWGLAIPKKFAPWFGTLVTIKESGGSLILESGPRLEALSTREIKSGAVIGEFIKI